MIACRKHLDVMRFHIFDQMLWSLVGLVARNNYSSVATVDSNREIQPPTNTFTVRVIRIGARTLRISNKLACWPVIPFPCLF